MISSEERFPLPSGIDTQESANDIIRQLPPTIIPRVSPIAKIASLVETHELTDDLFGLIVLKELPELENKYRDHYSELRDKRPQLRNSLIQKGMVKHDSDLSRQNDNVLPSCCAIDGSRTLERGKI
jgi:hypothetical protein